jgi:hypothetical protein
MKTTINCIPPVDYKSNQSNGIFINNITTMKSIRFAKHVAGMEMGEIPS